MSASPTGVDGLPAAARPEVLELADGDAIDLEIAPVRNRIGEATVRMLAYNGSIPGPTLRAREGSTVTARVTNRGDFEKTVHWPVRRGADPRGMGRFGNVMLVSGEPDLSLAAREARSCAST